MKLVIKATCITLSLLYITTLCIFATCSEASYSWYVKRNKDHKQPEIDASMSFMKKYDAFYVDENKKNDKVLYLTFDAGYENGNVEKIVDVLIDKNVPAAFFLLDNIIVKNTELVKRMAENNCVVCNHTRTHRDMSKVKSKEEFEKELSSLEKIYKDTTGYDMAKFYRPPEGKFSELNLQHAQELGYKTVFWSFAYADWDNDDQPSLDYAKKKILDNTHSGAIILLHPTSCTNAAILGDLIDEWRNMGYTFASIEDL